MTFRARGRVIARMWLVGALAATVSAILGVWLWRASHVPAAGKSGAPPPIAQGSADGGGGGAGNRESASRPSIESDDPQAVLLREKWGIRVDSFLLLAGGVVLDLRYTVFDSHKAAEMAYEETDSSLIDERTGIRYDGVKISKSGSLRQSGLNLRERRGYSMLIPNPGRRFKSGDVVTVVMGDFRVEKLKLQ